MSTPDLLEQTFKEQSVLFERASDLGGLINSFSNPDIRKNGRFLTGVGISYEFPAQDTIVRGLSSGMPIDVLSYLATVALIHKHLDLENKTFFIIADHFARGVEGIPENDIEAKAKDHKAIFTDIAQNLKIRGTSQTLADVIDIRLVSNDIEVNQSIYHKHYNNLKNSGSFNEYEKRQTATIATYNEVYGVKGKISYAVENKPQIQEVRARRDERYFDQLIQNYDSKIDLKYAYVDAGRTLNPNRPRTCPYIVPEMQQRSRLLLGESFDKFLSEKEKFTSGRKKKRFKEVTGYFLGLSQLVNTAFDGKSYICGKLLEDSIFSDFSKLEGTDLC